MFVRLRNAWHRVRRYPDCAVFFVPFTSMGPNDPVETIWSKMANLRGGFPRWIHMPQMREGLVKVLKGSGVREPPREVVLFGHPSSTWSGFAINPLSGSTEDILLPDWWLISNHRFEWILAHVCYGAKVLSTEPWRRVFPAWLSYREDIHALLVTDSDVAIWASLGKSLVYAAVNSKTIRSLERRVRATYLERMAELMDSGDSLDARNLIHEMHLQKAMDSISTSEDLT